MDPTTDYDAQYEMYVPAYQEALAAGDGRLAEACEGEILQTARGLLAFAIHHSYPAASRELVEDAVTEASIEVLAMARTWDPGRDVSFSKWLSAKKSPWRPFAAECVEDGRNKAHLKPVERRVLEVGRGAAAEFFATHGREPTKRELRALVEERVAMHGEDREDAEKRNTRSGFSAAVRDLERLWDGASAYVHPDTAGADGTGIWNLFEKVGVDPTGDGACALDQSGMLAQLAGMSLADALGDGRVPAATRENAMARMGSPHAQWAFLVARLDPVGAHPSRGDPPRSGP